MPLFVGFFVEAEWLLAVALVGDDGRDAAVFQFVAQLLAVVGLVAQEFFCIFASVDQALADRAVMRLTAAQKEGKKTAFSISNCVDFRIAPAARASNRLRLLPLFPPDAER